MQEVILKIKRDFGNKKARTKNPGLFRIQDATCDNLYKKKRRYNR